MLIYLVLDDDTEGSLPTCPETCSGHPLRLWSVERVGKAWGHFATASLNGEQRVIDASLPTRVSRVPTGAIHLMDNETARHWHHDNESHVFGGPNVAKALRQAVKQGEE